MTNMEWIAAGNTGCTFATLFARKPESVGWTHVTSEHYDKHRMSKHTNYLLASIEFPPDWNAKKVREWCKKWSWFNEVEVGEEYIGLRYNPSINGFSQSKESWVQYFGPDSHVVTRQTPNPMIMYTRKLNPLGYVKQVGFTGILHLAHAFSVHITEKMADILWKRSFEQVKRKIGHTPTIREAAKTTWLKKDVK